MSGEFAREFPKIAGRLALDEFECPDPYIERLIEAFAFVGARVQLKLDAEFPRFTQALLETVYPHYLAPTPSMAIVQFQPDFRQGALEKGFPIPRGAVLRSRLSQDMLTHCRYVTAHDLKLYPFSIDEAEYHTRDLAAQDLPAGLEAKAALRLKLGMPPGKKIKKVKCDALTFHLRGTDDNAMQMYEQLFAHATRVIVRPAVKGKDRQEIILPKNVLKPIGFGPGEALLPHGPRSFHGYRLLQEFFAFPQRYMFFEVSGFENVLKKADADAFEILILFDAVDLDLENNVGASLFDLNCTPAINLFPHRCDRIHVSDAHFEHHVVPDRTRPMDYEVYQITRVTGYGRDPSDRQNFSSFYAVTDLDADGDSGMAFYVSHRTPRIASQQQLRRGSRLSYLGSEVALSLVDSQSAPYSHDLRQIGVEALCTNRDLPLRMPVGRGGTDFTVDLSAPVKAIRCISGPTSPRPSRAEGEFSWRLISHLAPNYLTLAGDNPRRNAEALRNLLNLYVDDDNPAMAKQIQGIVTVTASPVTRRVGADGAIAFARGLEILVKLDEAGFAGVGAFLMGAVLEQFFSRYVSINSFTETVIETLDRGEIMRWKARLGQRGTI